MGSLKKTVRHVEHRQLSEQLQAAEARIADQDRQIGGLMKTIDSLRKRRNPRKVGKPTRRQRAQGDIIEVAFGDVHGNQAEDAAMAALVADLRDIRPDRLVVGGDLINCGGFLAEHHTLGYVAETEDSYADDVAQSNHWLDAILDAAGSEEVLYLEGNHECLTPGHEAYVRNQGWTPIENVEIGQEVGAMTDKGVFQWSEVLATPSYDIAEDIYYYDGTRLRFKATGSHRFWYWNQTRTDLLCRKLRRMCQGEAMYADIPGSAANPNPALEGVSNDELSILGWSLSDGHVAQSKWEIYQSKTENTLIIRGLLKRLGVRFSETERVRPSPFQGEALPSTVFRISVHEPLFQKLFPGRTRCVPGWAFDLSKEQFSTFLDAVLLGDGTRTGDAFCIYGKKDELADFQALLIFNGFRAHFSVRNRKGNPSYDALNVCPRQHIRFDARSVKKEHYTGPVYCLTTREDNFFCRFEGNAFLSGNSRVERWVLNQKLAHKKDIETLRRQFAPEYVLGLESRGIRYYRRDTVHDPCGVPGWIRLDKVYYAHDVTTAQNAAAEALRKASSNIVYFHTHRAESRTQHVPGVGMISAWNPGCLCKRQPLYLHTKPSGWSHGYLVRFISRKTGNFQVVPIAIDNGVSYGGAILHRPEEEKHEPEKDS